MVEEEDSRTFSRYLIEPREEAELPRDDEGKRTVAANKFIIRIMNEIGDIPIYTAADEDEVKEILGRELADREKRQYLEGTIDSSEDPYYDMGQLKQLMSDMGVLLSDKQLDCLFTILLRKSARLNSFKPELLSEIIDDGVSFIKNKREMESRENTPALI